MRTSYLTNNVITNWLPCFIRFSWIRHPKGSTSLQMPSWAAHLQGYTLGMNLLATLHYPVSGQKEGCIF